MFPWQSANRSFPCPASSVRNSVPFCGGRAWRRGWPSERGPSCFWRMGLRCRQRGGSFRCSAAIFTSGPTDSSGKESRGFTTGNGQADHLSFPPEVAIQLVKIACERPDDVGRSLSHWDCAELARQLVADGVVESI